MKKRLTALLLTAAMAASLAACSGSSETGTTTAGGSSRLRGVRPQEARPRMPPKGKRMRQRPLANP